jgi:hypothetical protein
MTMTAEETLSVQLERLRAILAMLEVVPPGQRHDELIERARIAIAAVRKTREAIAENGGRAGAARTSRTFGCVIDYASASR